MRTQGFLAAVLLVACAGAETEPPNGGSTGDAGGSVGLIGGASNGGAPGSGGAIEGAGGSGGVPNIGGARGSAEDGGAGGQGSCDPAACQVDIESILSMPPDTTTLTFDSCTGGCVCCSGSSYADPITSDCITCSIDASLAENGITRSGGLGTYFVDCITGNTDAPIGHAALFAGGNTLTLDFATAVSFFGFTALPTADISQPTVTLEGFTAGGELTGIDTFDFLVPGGDCGTSNPAARFFGFRSCCGAIAQVVVTFSEPNTAIDSISFY